MKHVAKLIARIGVLVVMASMLSLWAFSFHPRCKKLVDQQVTAVFENLYKARFSGKIDTISFLSLSVLYKDVVVVPLENHKQWQWKAQTFRLQFSVLTYLKSKKIGLFLFLSGCKGFSYVTDYYLHLHDHLALLFAPPKDSLFDLEKLIFVKSSLEVEDTKREVKASCCWESTTEKSLERLATRITLCEGRCSYAGKLLVSHLQGTLETAFKNEALGVHFFLDALVAGFPTGKNRCYAKGSFNETGGKGQMHTDDHLVSLSPFSIKIKKETQDIECDFKGECPLAYGLGICGIDPQCAQGNCFFEGSGSLKQGFKATVLCKNSFYAGYGCDLLKTSFEYKDALVRGSIFLQDGTQTASGIGTIDFENKTITCNLCNTIDWNILKTAWMIPQKSFQISLVSDFNGQGTAEYKATVEHKKTEQQFINSGIIHFSKTNATWNSTVCTTHKKYFFKGVAHPFSCTIKEEGSEKKPLVSIAGSQTEIAGTIDGSFIQELLHEWFQIKMMWSGPLIFTGKWQGTTAQGTLLFDDGFAKIGPFYNFIKTAKADFSFNFLKRILCLQNVQLALQKGTITSTCLMFGYDYVRQKPWAHLPFVFDDCFVNWQKDLYAQVSGALVFKKAFQGLPKLSGFMVFDRAHLKENVFSQEAQRMMAELLTSSGSTPEIDYDLFCASRSPVIIKTPELETTAQFALHCLTEPSNQEQASIKGTILISGGVLHFPAYGLPVVKGSISWKGQEVADPLIELVAQGRIKKYLITLSCAGTATDPHIIFDATPSLSQEQIMMLLFAGSEEESLNIAVPSLVMRNVENFIFGNTTGTRTKKWLEPLKRIKFIPRFTDQTGRGGFKGALEIEVSKRLRAMIEKNFSLTEDVAFEVEYALTDGVSIRAVRDERGDLGAHIEMRFKF